MMTLRDCLRSGDVWVEGSRAFRAFGDFLLPPEAFVTRRQEGESGLAVPDRFDDWRAERSRFLKSRLQEIDTLAAAGKLVEAAITAEGLSISPIRKDENDKSDDVARRLYGMFPVCGSPSCSPKSMVGQDQWSASVIFAPARRPMKTSV